MNMSPFCEAVLLLLIACVTRDVTSRRDYDQDYVIPSPRIEVFKPRGLKVSIPHTRGLELFAFHANVNKPMYGLEGGSISRDVVNRTGDEWIFESDEVQIRNGDTIYYWLFVIKDSLGYRLDNGVYEVRNTIKKGDELPADVHRPQTETIDDLSTDVRSHDHQAQDTNNNSTRQLLFCQEITLNLTRNLLRLSAQVEEMRENDDILRNIVEKMSKDNTTWLTLRGARQPNDAQGLVQEVVRQKLLLPLSVKQAKWGSNKSIDFQVESLDDKIEIIKTAKEKLKKSKFSITY